MSDDETHQYSIWFAAHYAPGQREAIRFAWNGKHAAEFRDENEDLRSAIAHLILAEPNSAPIVLIRDILMEDAAWSREAWCAPEHFAELLSILLRRGGPEYLIDFAEAMNATFDTFGAAHQMNLSQQEVRALLQETDRLLLMRADGRRRSELEGARDLFRKLIEGSAAEGWFVVPPGTPVRNIRVFDPSTSSAHERSFFEAKFQALRRRLIRIFGGRVK